MADRFSRKRWPKIERWDMREEGDGYRVHDWDDTRKIIAIIPPGPEAERSASLTSASPLLALALLSIYDKVDLSAHPELRELAEEALRQAEVIEPDDEG